MEPKPELAAAVVLSTKEDYRLVRSVLAGFRCVAARCPPERSVEEILAGLPAACLLILDLDAVRPSNREFRRIRSAFPQVKILTVSSKSFHPELEESFRSYIHANLVKPLDEEELTFLVRSLLAP